MDDRYRILRFPEVKSLTGMGRSSIYVYVGEGLFPKPIRFARNMVGWPAAEIIQLNAAKIRGADEAELRQLVTRLEADRKRAA